MKEETKGIYGKPRFGMIVWMFAGVILLALIAGWMFLRSGHPDMHTHPQPADNKGALVLPQSGSNA